MKRLFFLFIISGLFFYSNVFCMKKSELKRFENSLGREIDKVDLEIRDIKEDLKFHENKKKLLEKVKAFDKKKKSQVFDTGLVLRCELMARDLKEKSVDTVQDDEIYKDLLDKKKEREFIRGSRILYGVVFGSFVAGFSLLCLCAHYSQGN